MSLFEIIMLLCFGFAWPFSIYRSWKSGSTKGKSLVFLYVVLAGYVSGILNKVFNHPDPVIIFYAVNLTLVAVDIVLFYRNRTLERKDGSR